MAQSFKLIGLNKPWKAAGFNSIYATIETGKEDWFHTRFHEQIFPDARLSILFDMFKNSEENLWHDKNHIVVVEYIENKRVITKLILDGIEEPKTIPNERL